MNPSVGTVLQVVISSEKEISVQSRYATTAMLECHKNESLAITLDTKSRSIPAAASPSLKYK